MPQLVFPFEASELIVDALVGISGEAMTILAAAGQSVPPPHSVRALLDTGTNISVVSAGVLAKLGLTPLKEASTETIIGNVSANLFVVSLGITNRSQPGADLFLHPDLVVMEMAESLSQGTDVLIGMDVLGQCRTTIDGPQARFTIDF
jgi:hypothetical protein